MNTPSTAIILPAFNEEESLGKLLSELREVVGDMEIVVINDGSSDCTAEVARAGGATVLDLACNVGVGGAVQAGLKYCLQAGYDVVLRCDADGQHPPSQVPVLLKALEKRDDDMVIGSRYLEIESFRSTAVRRAGIRCLCYMLSTICRAPVSDPTSGFFAIRKNLMHLFAECYPSDYPEPEALALMRRQGFSFSEVPVIFKEREAGVSSIGNWGTLYYAIKVGLALVVGRARPVNEDYSAARLARIYGGDHA